MYLDDSFSVTWKLENHLQQMLWFSETEKMINKSGNKKNIFIHSEYSLLVMAPVVDSNTVILVKPSRLWWRLTVESIRVGLLGCVYARRINSQYYFTWTDTRKDFLDLVFCTFTCLSKEHLSYEPSELCSASCFHCKLTILIFQFISVIMLVGI